MGPPRSKFDSAVFRTVEGMVSLVPMDSRSSGYNAFEPAARAFSDAWLQIKARPGVYVLIWLTLVLVPYILLSMAFSKPMSLAMQEIRVSLQFLVEGTESVPPELTESLLRLSGYQVALFLLITLAGIYHGAVLSGTVRRFRAKTFPTFLQALNDGASGYFGFLKAAAASAGHILWRPLAALFGGMLLGSALGQTMFYSLGFFVGVIFLFSGLYRFGLGPFIHLTLGLSAGESCALSREFYKQNRPVVSSLFLAAVLIPLIITFLLFSLLLNIGIYFGAGSIVLWFIQSMIQFTVMMALVNFAMNTFAPAPGSEAETRPGTDAAG